MAETVVIQFLLALFTDKMNRTLNSVSHIEIKTLKYINYYSVCRFQSGEIRSLVLMRAHRYRVFENREVGKIFGPKREEAIGDWIKISKTDKTA